MGNGECRICFEKIEKFQIFLTETYRKKNWWKTHCIPVNWTVFYRLVQKHQHFQAYCKDRTQKYTLCRLKNLKSDFFPLIFRQKYVLSAGSLEYDRSWTFCSVYAKIGWIRPISAEKIRFKEMNCRGMSWTGKKRNHFDVSLCEKASLHSPEKSTRY